MATRRNDPPGDPAFRKRTWAIHLNDLCEGQKKTSSENGEQSL